MGLPRGPYLAHSRPVQSGTVPRLPSGGGPIRNRSSDRSGRPATGGVGNPVEVDPPTSPLVIAPASNASPPLPQPVLTAAGSSLAPAPPVLDIAGPGSAPAPPVLSVGDLSSVPPFPPVSAPAGPSNGPAPPADPAPPTHVTIPISGVQVAGADQTPLQFQPGALNNPGPTSGVGPTVDVSGPLGAARVIAPPLDPPTGVMLAS